MRLPARLRLVEVAPDGLGEAQHEVGDFGEVTLQAVAVDRRLAEAGAQRIMVGAEAIEQGVEPVEVREVADADGAAADLVLIGRADAAPRGADLAGAAGVLAQRVEVAVDRQDERAGLGDAQDVGRDRYALSRRCARPRLFSAQGSRTTPLPMTDGVPRTMPDGSSESL